MRQHINIRQTTLVSHGRVQDGVEFFFLVMFFLKKEDRPGRALPPAAHDSGTLGAPPSALELKSAR